MNDKGASLRENCLSELKITAEMRMGICSGTLSAHENGSYF